MAKMKIKLNKKAVRDMMRSPEMQSILRERAKAMDIDHTTGDVIVAVKGTRAFARVRTNNKDNGALKRMRS